MLNKKVKCIASSVLFVLPLSLIASGLHQQALPQNNIQNDISQAQSSMKSAKSPSTSMPSQQPVQSVKDEIKSNVKKPSQVSQVKQTAQNIPEGSSAANSKNMPSSENLSQNAKNTGRSSISSAVNDQKNKESFYDANDNQ